MPSAVPHRSLSAVRPWNSSKQNRQSSTLQESKLLHDNERAQAMLHGNQKNGGVNGTSGKLLANHQTRNSQAIQSTSTSQQNAQAQCSQGGRQSVGRMNKREAEAQLHKRPTQRQRVGIQPVLKDEAYVRNTMHLPTRKEYPDAHQGVFKNPKDSICKAVQGLAELRSDFAPLATDAFQCTLHFTSAARNEVVVGEGRSKVSPPRPSPQILILYRELPKTLPILILWPNFMNKMSSRKYWTGSRPRISLTRNRSKELKLKKKMLSWTFIITPHALILYL